MIVSPNVIPVTLLSMWLVMRNVDNGALLLCNNVLIIELTVHSHYAFRCSYCSRSYYYQPASSSSFSSSSFWRRSSCLGFSGPLPP